MRQTDLHDFCKLVETVPPQTVGTTGTGRTGKVIDRSGYQGVEVFVQYGSITATNATFTATVFEGDVTGAMTSVANANLLGTQAGLGVGQAATRTSGVSKNVVHKAGYVGLKRYVSVNVKSTVTAGAVVAAGILLGNPNSSPVAS
jgi:hypothetical protein